MALEPAAPEKKIKKKSAKAQEREEVSKALAAASAANARQPVKDDEELTPAALGRLWVSRDLIVKLLEYEAFDALVRDCVVHMVTGSQSQLVRITTLVEGEPYLFMRQQTKVYLRHVPAFEGRNVSKLTVRLLLCA